MRFAHPQLLWLLLLLLPLGLFAWARLRAGQTALVRALGPSMAERLTAHLSPGRRRGRLLLLLLALAFLILGVAQPQRGTHYATATRRGIDLIVALDVSESMLAEDLKPSRLVQARHEIAGILDRLKGDRVGLVAFAGAAFVQCPLTLDYAAARMFLEFMTPELIPEPGTSLAEAIRVSLRAFGPEEEGFRALILITDGEDHVGDVRQAAQEARRAGVRVFAVGIGSETGEPIPLRDAQGKIEGYKKDNSGKVVLTRLDPSALEEIANVTGGLFIQAGGMLGLERILMEIDRMEKRELEAGIRVLYEERYFYFAWLVFACLIIEWRIPTRRIWRKSAAARRSAGRFRVGLIVLLLAVAIAAAQAQPATPSSGASPAVSRGGMPPGGVSSGMPPNLAEEGAEPLDQEWWQEQVE